MKLAFDNIQGPVYQLTQTDWQDGLQASRESPRGRFILPIHRRQDALVQRMLNFMQPGTYVRPHRHPRPGAVESIAVLKGAIRFRIFDDRGKVTREFDLKAGTPHSVVDIEPHVWHAFDVLEPDTILFETKMGPYDVNLDKEFASWSEEERY
ncbi:MAG: WbuC family cupin fold metalloprotein [Bacteroidetes bacterium]|nr:WbuC family cupin fold metalloprotein [Bacteroidota bacterium]